MRQKPCSHALLTSSAMCLVSLIVCVVDSSLLEERDLSTRSTKLSSTTSQRPSSLLAMETTQILTATTMMVEFKSQVECSSHCLARAWHVRVKLLCTWSLNIQRRSLSLVASVMVHLIWPMLWSVAPIPSLLLTSTVLLLIYVSQRCWSMHSWQQRADLDPRLIFRKQCRC